MTTCSIEGLWSHICGLSSWGLRALHTYDDVKEMWSHKASNYLFSGVAQEGVLYKDPQIAIF